MALEYSPPARGTWTIAHVPLLIPDAYVIFVGASCCMRGVVLSAEECGALDRFSMVLVSEDDLFNGKLESNFTSGVMEILDALPALPPCVVLFSGCIHETAGCDMDLIRSSLEARYPKVDFVMSKMNPTMRKSGITPEELMRMQLYAPLGTSRYRPPLSKCSGASSPAPCPPSVAAPSSVPLSAAASGVSSSVASSPSLAAASSAAPSATAASIAARPPSAARCVNIIGNIFPRSPKSEVLVMLRNGGYTVRDICTCRTYDDYLDMEGDAINVYMAPVAQKGAELLSRRLGQTLFHFPVSFNMDTVESLLRSFAAVADVSLPDIGALRAEAEASLARAAEAARSMQVALDFSAVSRPFELARLLYEHGLDVKTVYTDAVSPGDEEAFAWCKKTHFAVTSVTAVTSRFIHNKATHSALGEGGGKKWLAIGQKAAYFCNTRRFVNIVENGGLWGFMGIVQMARMIEDAAKEERDMRDIIQVKAWGCADACKRLAQARQ